LAKNIAAALPDRDNAAV